MNPRPLAAAALVVAVLTPLLAVAAPAEAARPTCRGVPATKIGQPKANMLGTRGRDVVVTNGARAYRTHGGDDLVCVTGSARQVSVDGTAADEQVYVVSRASRVDFAGGAGSDTFVGGPQYDLVRLTADGTDRIDTAGGGDFVGLGRAPDHRRISVSLGSGDDYLWVHDDGLTGLLDGGGGHDAFTLVHKSQKAWVLDNAAGQATADGQQRFRWRGLESFQLGFLRVPSITFLGGDGSEDVSQQDLEGPRPAFTFAMGGGDDSVQVAAKTSGSVDGGPGTDLVTFGVNFLDRLVGFSADLAAHSAVSTYADGSGGTWSLQGVEDLTALDYPTATLLGDDADNVFRTGNGDDTLVGRGGTDTADAGAGTDRCDAEVETGCELP